MEAPKPVQQRTELQDTRFGFKTAPGAPPQAHHEPPSANSQSQGRKPPVRTYTTQRNCTSRDLSLPPSKARISDRFPAPARVSRCTTIPESQSLDAETVPDSEEERLQQKSNSDTGQSSSEEEYSDATSIEKERGVADGEDDYEVDLAHNLGIALDVDNEIDEAALAEMDLDPFANENFGPGEFFFYARLFQLGMIAFTQRKR